MSRSQQTGVIVVLIIVAIIVGVGVLHNVSPSTSASAITIRDRSEPVQNVAPVGVSNPSHPASSSGVPLHNTVVAPVNQNVSQSAVSAPPSTEEVVVHVAGAVRKPGVYHLHPRARNDDALKAAGGPTGEANTDAVNLAAHVEDGSQLFFPTRKQVPEGGAVTPSHSTTAVTSTKAASPVVASAHKGRTANTRAGNNRNRGSSKSAKLSSPDDGQININTATSEELQRIPGVGPTMADRLIAYRTENGGFHSVEDLQQVSGIGPKKFEKMQPFVRVH